MIVSVFVVIIATVGMGLLLVNQKESRLQKMMPYIISLGTGMLIALCFTEFLPHSFENKSANVSILFILGIWIVILSEKYLAPRLSPKFQSCGHSKHSHNKTRISYNVACSSIGCILVCTFFDGLEISAGFEIGRRTGFLVSFGMILHTIPEGALAASIGIAGGFSKRSSQITVLLVGFATFLGAFIGLLASYIFSFQEFVLPIASGVLLYVSIGHLLPVSLKVKWGLAMLFAGMLMALILSMGHTDHITRIEKTGSYIVT